MAEVNKRFVNNLDVELVMNFEIPVNIFVYPYKLCSCNILYNLFKQITLGLVSA